MGRSASALPATKKSAAAWSTSISARSARSVCYTVDGHGSDEIDVETFSAETAEVTLRGVNIHPSIAKGRMTNALRVAADFLGRLPRDRLAPEATDGREGFIHPLEISGGVGEVKIRFLLRDFETARLGDLAQMLRQAADATLQDFPEARFEMAVTRTYLNMADGLVREPRAVGYAEKALARPGANGPKNDRPRRHRWFPLDRTWAAHAQPIQRGPFDSLPERMGLPGGDDAIGAVAGGTGGNLGAEKGKNRHNL